MYMCIYVHICADEYLHIYRVHIMSCLSAAYRNFLVWCRRVPLLQLGHLMLTRTTWFYVNGYRSSRRIAKTHTYIYVCYTLHQYHQPLTFVRTRVHIRTHTHTSACIRETPWYACALPEKDPPSFLLGQVEIPLLQQ